MPRGWCSDGLSGNIKEKITYGLPIMAKLEFVSGVWFWVRFWRKGSRKSLEGYIRYPKDLFHNKSHSILKSLQNYCTNLSSAQGKQSVWRLSTEASLAGGNNPLHFSNDIRKYRTWDSQFREHSHPHWLQLENML